MLLPLQIELELHAANAKPLCVVVFGIFDSIYSIDEHRNIETDGGVS